MMLNIVLWVSATACWVALLVFIRYYYSKQLKERDAEILLLKTASADLQAQLKEKERRHAYRIDFFEHKCTFEFVGFGDQQLDKLKHRKGEGLLKNVSRTGAQMICQFDLPVRKEIIIKIEFSLEDESFTFQGKIVRKEEQLQYISYGIAFIQMDPAEQQRLIRVLQKIELERKKS